MMDIFVILFMTWLIVTCVGHLSWLIVAAIFKAILPDESKPSSSQISARPKQDDFEATKRVINRLLVSGHLTQQRADELMLALQKIRFRQGVADARPSEVEHRVRSNGQRDIEAPASRVDTELVARQSARSQELIVEAAASNRGERIPPVTGERDVAAQGSSQDPKVVDALLVSPLSGDEDRKVSLATPTTSEVSVDSGSSDRASERPIKGTQDSSLAKVIQSFLSSHNIRWGEIVAGILIVVCSIGLVRTLWRPLASTHPLIPSLIFLVANVAIGAAGLYTLKRWKLRHTSRAVLIISVLLIPLSVLAGIAAVGKDVSLVASADPTTLLFIAAAIVFYSRLAHLCVTAVTHRAYSWLVTFVFLAPISLMPFVRAAIESLGPSAGWLFGIVALSIQVAASQLDQMNGGVSTGLRRPLSNVRLLFLGLGIYSLFISTAYFALCLRPANLSDYLALAVSLIPALVAYGASSFDLKKRSLIATHSLVGYVCVFLITTPAFIIAVPAAISADWIWSWAIALTASLIWASYRSCQPHWSALVALPTALSSIISVKVHGVIAVSTTSNLWSGLLSGETLLILLSMASLVGLWSLAERNQERKKWISRSLLFWAGSTLGISGVLVVLPVSFLGTLPLWGLQVVLGVSVVLATLACLPDALPRTKLIYGSSIQTILFCLALFKPVGWFAIESLEPLTWALLLAGASLWTVELLARRLKAGSWFQLDGPVATDRMVRFAFVDGIIAVSCIACLVMVGLCADLYRVSSILLAATFLMLLASISSLSLQRLRVSQLLSLLTIGLFTYQGLGVEGWVAAEYFSIESWLAGNPQWILIVPLIALLSIWLFMRESIAWFTKRATDTFIQRLADFSERSGDPRGSNKVWDLTNLKSSGQDFLIELGLLYAAIVLGFTAVLSGFSQTLYTLEVVTVAGNALTYVCCDLIVLLVLAFRIGSYCEASKTRFESVGSLVIMSIFLAAGILVSSVVDSSQGRTYLLILTTLVSAGGVIGCSWIAARGSETISRAGRRNWEVFFTVVVLIVSLRFMWVDWIGQVSRGEQPFLLTMIPVSIWSFLGAIWFRYGRSALVNSERYVLSLASFVMATIITTTLLVPPSTLELVQVSAFACLVWAITFLGAVHGNDHERSCAALRFALGFGLLVGGLTSLLTTFCVFVKVPYFTATLAGLLVSLVASVVLLSPLGSSYLAVGKSLQKYLVAGWPISVSLLAGQIAWVFFLLFNLNETETRICVGFVWVATSFAAFYQERFAPWSISRLHVIGVGVVTPLISLWLYPTEKVFCLLALFSLLSSGLLVRQMTHVETDSCDSDLRRIRISQFGMFRCIGWWVLVIGPFLVSSLISSVSLESTLELFPIWSVGWLLIWSVRNTSLGERSTGDREFADVCPGLGVIATLSVIATIDLVRAISDGAGVSIASGTGIPLIHYLKWVAFGFLPSVVIFRPTQRRIWFLGFYQLSIVVAYASLIVTSHWLLPLIDRVVVASLSIALLNALLSHWSGSISRAVSRVGGCSLDAAAACYPSLYSLIVLTTLGDVIAVVVMIANRFEASAIHLMVTSVALGGWAIAQCASAHQLAAFMNQQQIRKLAVATMLTAVALWAGVDMQLDQISILRLMMRWIVVSAILLPSMIWIIPRLLGTRIFKDWDNALRWGIVSVGQSVVFAISTMLCIEVMTRSSVGVIEIPDIQIFLVGCILAFLTLLLASVAVFSGPKFSLQKRFSLSDLNRECVIYGAELLAGCVWLHLYLCRPDWLYLELRENWYFVVMAIAFLSVGVTEFARRVEDQLLLKVLRRTAFLLPLIPLLGFWLQYADWLGPWLRVNNAIRYDVLLMIGAIFYGLVSQLWKHAWSRLVSIALGNAAWWFMLTQTPGWSFLEHPQLWMIPPAFCILFAVNHYRDRLGKNTVSAIRYASMLTIYLSSTADMLIQQIGVSLMGPIVLVLLSLAGMLAGVILRVRAFLFLGASFVFLGTTSMVWHANRSLGSSWPWWVFGITTGVLLLIGLSVLEKYKSKLKEYSEHLSRWDA